MSQEAHPNREVIHSPLVVPAKGMAPSRPPYALAPGEYQILENVRVDNGRIVARKGISEIQQGEAGGLRTPENLGGFVLSSPDFGTNPSGALHLGSFVTSAGKIVAAYHNPYTGVVFYTSSDGQTWHRICATTTAFSGDWDDAGTGRFDPVVTSRTNPWTFVEVPVDKRFSVASSTPPDQAQKTCVVASNGYETVVLHLAPVVDYSQSPAQIISGGFVEAHRPCKPPEQVAGTAPIATWTKYLPVSTVLPTVTSSGPFNHMSVGGAADPGEYTLTFSYTSVPGSVTNYHVTYTFPSVNAVSASKSDELVLIFDVTKDAGQLDSLLSGFKIGIVTDMYSGIVYDPKSTEVSSYTDHRFSGDVSAWTEATPPTVIGPPPQKPKKVKGFARMVRESVMYKQRLLAYEKALASASRGQPSTLVTSTADIAIVSFPLSSIQWATSDRLAYTGLSSIRGIYFKPTEEASATYPSGPRPTTFEYTGVRIIGVAVTGQWPGLGQWAVADANLGAMSESQTVRLMNGNGAHSSTIGVSKAYSFRIPELPSLRYDYFIPASNHLKDIGSSGPPVLARSYANAAILYRRDFGAEDFYYVGTYRKYTYSPSLGGTPPPVVTQQISPTTPSYGPYTHRWLDLSSKLLTWMDSDWNGNKLPYFQALPQKADVLVADSSVESSCVPPFTCAAYASDRLFVGNADKLYVSHLGVPLRHTSYSVVDLDPWYATRAATVKPLQSPVRAIIPMSGSMLGANQIYIFTNDSVVAMDSTNPLAPLNVLTRSGCANGRTATSWAQSVYVLDDQLRFMEYNNGGIGDASTGFVDKLLYIDGGSHARQKAFAEYHGRSIYLSRIREDGSVGLLVLDDMNRTWVSDSHQWSDVEFSQLLSARISRDDSPYGRLFAFSKYGGRVFDYESQSDRDVGPAQPGSNIQEKRDIGVRILTRAISNGPFDSVSFGRVGILCDPQPGGVAVVSKIVPSHGHPGRGYGNATKSTALLNDGGWVWSGMEPGSGVRGPWAAVDVEANVEAGWELSALVAEVSANGGGQS